MVTKKAKVIMLPTENSTHIYTGNDGTIYYTKVSKLRFRNEGCHLYIISDEEIKEGDWCINPNNYPEIFGYDFRAVYTKEQILSCKKIIATTDESLMYLSNNGRIRYNLPQVPQSFIKEYCEKGSIDEVLVEYEIRSNAALGYNEYVYLQHIEGKRYTPIKIDASIHQDSYELGKEKEFEDYELETLLKVAPDNTIIIKSVKDSWNREEVLNLCEDYYDTLVGNLDQTCCPMDDERQLIKNWIKENLK